MKNLFIIQEHSFLNIDLDNVCLFCANAGKILIYIDNIKISKKPLVI